LCQDRYCFSVRTHSMKTCVYEGMCMKALHYAMKALHTLYEGSGPEREARDYTHSMKALPRLY
jgi:hypothetical protein